MDLELIFGILVALVIVVLTSIAPKLLSWILILTAFFGITAAGVYTNGFPEGLIGGMALGGFLAFLFWLRFGNSFAETERARSQLENHSKCQRCGNKLSYHRVPKNLGQLLLGGLTCKNCGAEYSVSLDQLILK